MPKHSELIHHKISVSDVFAICPTDSVAIEASVTSVNTEAWHSSPTVLSPPPHCHPVFFYNFSIESLFPDGLTGLPHHHKANVAYCAECFMCTHLTGICPGQEFGVGKLDSWQHGGDRARRRSVLEHSQGFWYMHACTRRLPLTVSALKISCCLHDYLLLMRQQMRFLLLRNLTEADIPSDS